jgi:transcriptional regulator with GAF, ATPase, and Fis domain
MFVMAVAKMASPFPFALAESELFGYEKDAFSEAIASEQPRESVTA